MIHGNVSDLMQKDIDESEVFMCCATTQYCASVNCKRELKYASYMKKKILYILFESFNGADDRNENLHAIAFYMAEEKYYKHEDVNGIDNALKALVRLYLSLYFIFNYSNKKTAVNYLSLDRN
jgi:hypothetical protein